MAKVLVIDDSQLICRLVQMYLKNVGCEVDYCTSPFGVLQKVKDFKPDVVLLDMRMPGLSGKGVARLLNKGDCGHGFKTILFSSEDENLLKQMVEEGFVDDYLVKTHDLEGLKEKIHNLLATA